MSRQSQGSGLGRRCGVGMTYDRALSLLLGAGLSWDEACEVARAFEADAAQEASPPKEEIAA